MRVIEFCATVVGVVALLLLPVALAAEGENVLSFNSPDELDKAIQENDFLAVKFVAPWCGHCNHLAPHWNAAADEFAAGNAESESESESEDDESQSQSQSSLKIKLGNVDMTKEENKPLFERFEIKGFPTIKIFKKGQVLNYEGPREKNGIVNYLIKQAGPSFISLPSPSFNEKKSKILSQNAVVAVFGKSHSDKESEAEINFKNLADKLKDRMLFVVSEGKEEVVVYSKPQKKTLSLPPPYSLSQLSSFLIDSSLVTFGQLTAEQSPAMDAFLNTKRIRFLNFVDASEKEQVSVVESLPSSLPPPLSSSFFIAFIDAPNFPQAVQHFGIEGKKLPFSLIVKYNDEEEEGGKEKKVGKEVKYGYGGEWSAEKLVAFASDAVSGKAEVFIKSEAPVDNSDRDVWKIVRSNFDELIKNSPNEVLLKIYAPWCSHCKALEPSFITVAKALKKHLPTSNSDISKSGIVIADFDATANELPAGISIKGYPTLLYFKGKTAGNEKNEPVAYDEARTARAMTSFLVKNSRFSVQVDESELPVESSSHGGVEGLSFLDTVLDALDEQYAFGISGYILAGISLVFLLLSVVLCVSAAKNGKKEGEGESDAEVKKRKKTDGDEKKEEKEEKKEAEEVKASTPKKKTSAKKSQKDE